MNYEQAMSFINGAQGHGEKVGLHNMELLLERLGNPHRQFKSVHVAGTNGKGSICAFIETVLRKAGYKTGLYTSPYLMRYNERMRLMGVPILDERLAQITEVVSNVVEDLRAVGTKPTIFEIGTAIAFVLFAQENVDIAIIEVGLGGRFDPTNVIEPLVCAIGAIGLDHMKVLGDTIIKIAGEKAGIIKHGVPCIIHPQEESVREVFRAKCAEVKAPLYDLSTQQFQMKVESPYGLSFTFGSDEQSAIPLELHMPGSHQATNAATAYMSLVQLRNFGFNITDEQIFNGIKATKWHGRLEWLRGEPDILLDGAHNGQGAKSLVEYVKRNLHDRKKVLVFAMLKDKPVEEVARILSNITELVIATKVDYPRAAETSRLQAVLYANGVMCECIEDIGSAIEHAKRLAGTDGVVIISGSLYLVGAARSYLLPQSDGSLD